jgi:hypothetical protein
MRPRPSPTPQHHPTKTDKSLSWIERQAKRIVIIGLVLVFLESLYINWAILQEKNDRRAQVNGAICSIIRAIPPGNFRIDQVRASFKCGPYTPPPIPTAPSTSPGSPKSTSPHASPSRTPRTKPHTTHEALPTPPVVIQTQTKTRVSHSRSTRTVTKTRSRTATRTVSRPAPSPPPSSPGVLDPICKLFPLIC